MKLDLKIKQVKSVTKRNIFGEAVTYSEFYAVYFKMFGFLKVYLWVNPSLYAWDYDGVIEVKFRPLEYATTYTEKSEAQALIDDIYKNPNKYVRA